MVHQGWDLWYVIFPIVILGIALSHYSKPKTGILLLYILLFFSMFRGDHVGNDTMNYLDETTISYAASSFESPSADDVIDNLGKKIEFSSLALNWLVYNLDLPPRIIIFTYSILLFVFLYLALRRLRINISLALMFFVLSGLYYFSLTAARQMAALGIMAYGITFLFENNKRRHLFFVFTIIAASFHISAVFFVWLFALRFISINRKMSMVIVSCIGLVTILISFNITDYIYRFFNLEYVARYMGMFDESERSLLGRINDLILLSFSLCVFMKRRGGDRTDLFDNLFLLGLILWALFSHSSMLIARITYYVTVFEVFFFSKIIRENQCFKDKRFMAVFALYCLVTIYGMRGWAETLTSGYYLMF